MKPARKSQTVALLIPRRLNERVARLFLGSIKSAAERDALALLLTRQRSGARRIVYILEQWCREQEAKE